MSRHAMKRDANEPALVALARTLGAYMVRLDTPCDWLCGYRGDWFPVECKNPEGKNRLEPAQIEFQTECYKRSLTIRYWRTSSDVLRDLHAKATA